VQVRSHTAAVVVVEVVESDAAQQKKRGLVGLRVHGRKTRGEGRELQRLLNAQRVNLLTTHGRHRNPDVLSGLGASLRRDNDFLECVVAAVRVYVGGGVIGESHHGS